MISDEDGSEPCIILVGDVGSGKSTLIEKLTGTVGRSSAAKESFTKDSMMFRIVDKLKICDTPGSNAMKQNFEHNAWIAKAINSQKVSRLCIVVRADKTIENVVGNMNNYMENFLDLPDEVLCACITHMDLVPWKHNDLLDIVEEETGMKSQNVIFSNLNTNQNTLLDAFLKQCEKAHAVIVNAKHFKIKDININIEKSINKEINRFGDIVEQLFEAKKTFDLQEQIEVLYEFHAWMKHEVNRSQKKIAAEYNFMFLDKSKDIDLEMGYIISLTGQLQAKLKALEIEINQYNSQMTTLERKCPYCSNCITKKSLFDGFVTCGNHSTTTEPKYKIGEDTGVKKIELGSFTFVLKGSTLVVEKKRRCRPILPEIFGRGCGRTMSWSSMVPIYKKIYNEDCCQTISRLNNKAEFKELENRLEMKTVTSDNSLISEANPKINLPYDIKDNKPKVDNKGHKKLLQENGKNSAINVKDQVSSTGHDKENTGRCIDYSLSTNKTENIESKMGTIIEYSQPSKNISEEGSSEQKEDKEVCHVDVEAPHGPSTSISDNHKIDMLENTHCRLVKFSHYEVIQEEESYQFQIWEQYIEERKEYQRKELLKLIDEENSIKIRKQEIDILRKELEALEKTGYSIENNMGHKSEDHGGKNETLENPERGSLHLKKDHNRSEKNNDAEITNHFGMANKPDRLIQNREKRKLTAKSHSRINPYSKKPPYNANLYLDANELKETPKKESNSTESKSFVSVITTLIVQDCPKKDLDVESINNIIMYYLNRIPDENEKREVKQNILKWEPQQNDVKTYSRDNSKYKQEVPIRFYVNEGAHKNAQKYVDNYFYKVYRCSVKCNLIII